MHGFYHSSRGFVTSKMKFLLTFAFLLTLQLCAPLVQVKQEARQQKSVDAGAAKTAIAEKTNHPDNIFLPYATRRVKIFIATRTPHVLQG